MTGTPPYSNMIVSWRLRGESFTGLFDSASAVTVLVASGSDVWTLRTGGVKFVVCTVRRGGGGRWCTVISTGLSMGRDRSDDCGDIFVDVELADTESSGL